MTINKLVEQRFGLPTKIGNGVTSNTTLSNILARRSCRSYKPKPVPEKLIQVLFASAFSAPSKSDLQQACVIRIEDQDKQKRIADLSPHTTWITKAPLFMVWCGDSRRIRRLSEMRNHPFANDHLDAFMNAAVDAAIAMQTFIVAAESVGLGCCPVSQVRDQIKPLSVELELPRWVFPIAGLCVGWPDRETRISLRLPLQTTIHTNSYDDSELVEQVTDYDRRREAIEKTPPTQQRMVEKFGVSAAYGWSENRTRQYAIPARAGFGRYVRDQGFNLS
ncbi:MAG: nitroreductase family protein [Arenicellales bacterium]|nr:nitroreductase family protein [Arenicellales bacterium]